MTMWPADILRRCWFVCGPTAVGKTATGLALAQRIDAEILSLDSMAIYRGMDIGTAKPSAAEQAQVPHHLIDIVDPWEEYSTAEYLTAAEAVCRELVARGKAPLFVGGTGLYLRAILRGVFEGPSADWEFRHRLMAEAAVPGALSLHERLRQVDPVSAGRLHPNDERRLVRALEIHHLTGQPASDLQQQSPRPLDERPQHVYWLEPPRDWLHERINRRVDVMLEQGLIEEVERLLALEPPLGRTARQGLGYKEVIDFFEGRIPSREELAETVKTRTRQFAKRQHTWFRNLEECRAIAITGEESLEDIAEMLMERG